MPKLRTLFGALDPGLQQYLLVTGNYWFFTLTDGALRMLVLLYFYQLGYGPLAIATLFVFYEVAGVFTNLIGGWLGAKFGLNRTMNAGLLLQVLALLLLTVPDELLTVAWVMFVQSLSGVAKDLNKMSAKTSIKVLVPANRQGQLFKWVSILTGSKNTLKGLGFFLGGFLLTTLGFRPSLYLMALVLAVVALISMISLRPSLGKANAKPKFTELLSKSRSLNLFSAARLCLFAARDVWFVVALPVYLASQLNWQHSEVGAFLALWIVFYGFVQALTPRLLGMLPGHEPSAKAMALWGWYLALTTAALLVLLWFFDHQPIVMVIGLLLFALVFAVNSALHSYGILALAKQDGASLDVGFYYMSNALGRLLGTLLSGLLFQYYGLLACLLVSVVLAMLAASLVRRIQL